MKRKIRAGWVENPELSEYYGYESTSQNGIQVFAYEDRQPDVLYVPDHQRGGFQAKVITPPKRRLGF